MLTDTNTIPKYVQQRQEDTNDKTFIELLLQQVKLKTLKIILKIA